MKYYSYPNFISRNLNKEEGFTLLGCSVFLGLCFFFTPKSVAGNTTYWFMWICVIATAIGIVLYVYTSLKKVRRKKYLEFLAFEKQGLIRINIEYSENLIELLGHLRFIKEMDEKRHINFTELCNYLDLINIAEDHFEQAKSFLIQEQKFELISQLEELRAYSAKKNVAVDVHNEIETATDTLLENKTDALNLIDEINLRRKEVASKIDWLSKKIEELG